MITKYKPKVDVTASKTAMIYKLELDIAQQTTMVAMSKAKYESFAEKTATYQALLNNANTLLGIATQNYNQYMTTKNDLEVCKKACNTSDQISDESLFFVRQMVRQWYSVTEQTLQAATLINASTEYIQNQKAANPLISDDLVAQAVNANDNAATTVKVVISALEEAISALSIAGMASQNTSETNLDASITSNLLNEGSIEELPVKTKEEMQIFTPVEVFVTEAHNEAQIRVNNYQVALATITEQTAQAKKEMEANQSELDSLNSALAAAETAVAG